MSTLNTFVGPRILVKFAGQWDSNSRYDYMTAVYDENWQSWLSKCDVPSGVPLEEGRYWLKWESPNAQFHLLQETVQSFDGRITDNTDRINQLGTASNLNWTESVSSGSPDLVTSGGVFNEVVLKTNKKPKALIIGDSWGSGFVSTGVFYPIKDFLDDYFEVTSDCVGGTGFLTDNSFGTRVATDLQENSDYDIIIFEGGVNDQNKDSDLMVQGANQAFQKAKDLAPNAKIYWAPNCTRGRAFEAVKLYSTKNAVVLPTYKVGFYLFLFKSGDDYHLAGENEYRTFANMIVYGILSGQDYCDFLYYSSEPQSFEVPTTQGTGHVTVSYRNCWMGQYYFCDIGADYTEADNTLYPIEMIDEKKVLIPQFGFPSDGVASKVYMPFIFGNVSNPESSNYKFIYKQVQSNAASISPQIVASSTQPYVSFSYSIHTGQYIKPPTTQYYGNRKACTWDGGSYFTPSSYAA